MKDRDHLGSNREVSKITGNTFTSVQQTAYYPSGLPYPGWEGGNEQPYKFHDKEFIEMHGYDMYDFHARGYYPAIMRFTSPDPHAESYYHISPYAYCANNPIRFNDPTGMFIVAASQNEWAIQTQQTITMRDGLQNKIDRLRAKSNEKGWSENKLNRKIGNKQERVDYLSSAIENFTVMEDSPQCYSLNPNNNNEKDLTYSSETGNITLNYSGTEFFIHESVHAGQFESNDIGFDGNTGNAVMNDVFDEMQAYRAQWAYSPSSVGNLNSANQINQQWIHNITDANVGDKPYNPGGRFNTGLAPVNTHTTKAGIISAYPYMRGALLGQSPDVTFINLIPNLIIR